MFIGTQYFRPPHPNRTYGERDLHNIADTGILLILICIYWSQVNPRLGEWQRDDVDAFFDAARKRGWAIIVWLMIFKPLCHSLPRQKQYLNGLLRLQ